MRTKTFDFNQYKLGKDHIDCGIQGEHKATQLRLICSVKNPDEKNFKLVFENGGTSETLYSNNGEVFYEIPQSLTLLKSVKTTLEGYEGKERIYKSPVIWLDFSECAKAIKPVDSQVESFNAEVASLNKKLSTAIDELSNNASNPLMQNIIASTENPIELKDVSPNNHVIALKVYKKNLISFPYKDGSSKVSEGIRFNVNNDGTIRITGTGIPIKNNAKFFVSDNITLLDSQEYSLSERTLMCYDHNGRTKYLGSWSGPFIWRKSYTAPYIYVEIPKGESVVLSNIKPQLELGKVSTSYEKGIDASNVKVTVFDESNKSTQYSVNSHGMAYIKSISPYMRIEVSDKNLNIAFSYQKDIKEGIKQCGSNDYEKLINIPKINGEELRGDFKITKEKLGLKDGAQGVKGDRGPQGLKGDKGDEGASPTVEIEPISGGSRVIFKDKSGQKFIDVMNGKDGVDLPLTEDKTTFFDSTPTINLFNAYDTENKKNSQLRPNGTVATNSEWYSTVSHKISVKSMPRDYYRTNNPERARIAEYDVNNNFIGIKEILNGSYITLNDNTDYVRMEFFGSGERWVFGRSIAPIVSYVPFGNEYELKKKYIDSYLPKIPISTRPVFTKKALLSNAEKLSTADVAQIKANYQISFRARINNFESIKISNDGEAVFSASSLIIDNTNLTIKRYSQTHETVPHGLNIKDYIDVVIAARDDFKADITVTTNSGTVQKTMFWNGSGGKISVVPTNSELTDCYLSWYSQDLYKPIWAFGDSFFDGWPHLLTAMGFKNFMIDGVSGRGAVGAWNSLQKAMTFNTPEKILWCMGMNDGENGSMNQGWYNRYLDVAKYCDQNNIELILTTIPTNRNSSHEIKNKFIREESGRRYVDIAKAVGADISPEWYEGLLSSDGTHPTQKGYYVIAHRVATDVPELKKL